MSLSQESTEWHLTPGGWQRGTERMDFGNVTVVEPPSDRVATYRWVEKLSSA